MAAPQIEERFLTAGREYNTALADLGLEPHALFWAFDKDEQRHVLVLITDFFDLKGPLEISRQLFRAYNASVTPREIDPFVVRLYSTNQPAGDSLLIFTAGDWTINQVDKLTQQPIGDKHAVSEVSTNGLEIRPEWVVHVKQSVKSRNSVELNRRWQRFTRNVDRAAA